VSLFDYLYIEDENLDHIYDDHQVGVFSPEMLAAMDDFISTKNLYLEKRTIHPGQSVAFEAAETITAGNNFIVESGGKVDMKSLKTFLKPGFHAKEGSTAHIKVDNSWICPPGSIQSVSFFPLSNLVWEEEPEDQTQILPQIPTSEEQPTHSIVQEMEDEIRFFPNPVENTLNLQILNRVEGEIRITIIDANGYPVYSQLITNNVTKAIDCSQFIGGVYFVHITFKGGTRTIKLIKK
jgi:hypothetical protein